MLKETEAEEARLFCHIFVIGGIWHWWPWPPRYAYDCSFNPICDIKILRAFLLICPWVHVKATLMVLFSMIMLNMLYCW